MWLYAVTIFLSAFLLFQVQPVIARMILPWFGGSAAVWTTCLLFFQTVLLLGYLYAHWAVRQLRPTHHAWLHVTLLLASLLLLPITPSERWKPEPEANPSLQILLLLGACVGGPYFLLSTTSPLLQWWYAQRRQGILPYRLFALSNFGSMVALLSYPLAVEPLLSTRSQGLAWSAGYAVFALLCSATAFVSTRAGHRFQAAADAGAAPEPVENPDPHLKWFWLALAFCPSALLLAVTSHLTQDVASIPFLWIAPLALYLLSFILCFDAEGWYRRSVFLPMLIPALAAMAYMLRTGTEDISLRIQLLAFCSAFFVCAMVCHGELVRLKPHPSRLTSFYFMLAAGGALGGLFAGLAAPYLFPSYFEFPIALVLCGALAVAALLRDPASRFYHDWQSWPVIFMAAGLVALAVYCAQIVRLSLRDYKIARRNFYGALRVRESGKPGEWEQYRTLLHGAINHGEQWVHPDRRRELLTYYCRDTGVGRAIRLRDPGKPQKVGVFGLGAGSLAAYGRPGDHYKFYEINPLVLELARSEFYYLAESRAKVEVVLGDARLSLEREPPQQFDVLAVDCFSGDSIPVHLITREALRLYFRHLKPDGILALHLSNRFLDLEPVVERIATSLGKATLLVETEDDEAGDCFGTTWVLVASEARLFAHKIFDGAGHPVPSRPGAPLWTDDYSSLYRILK